LQFQSVVPKQVLAVTALVEIIGVDVEATVSRDETKPEVVAPHRGMAALFECS